MRSRFLPLSFALLLTIVFLVVQASQVATLGIILYHDHHLCHASRLEFQPARLSDGPEFVLSVFSPLNSFLRCDLVFRTSCLIEGTKAPTGWISMDFDGFRMIPPGTGPTDGCSRSEGCACRCQESRSGCLAKAAHCQPTDSKLVHHKIWEP